MGYFDSPNQCFRNDLHKNVYTDEMIIHVHFTGGGIISWQVEVKEETPNAIYRT